MKVGFTGTQVGMTQAQRELVSLYIKELCTGDQFDHGDCIGADTDAHNIALQFGCKIHIHPPINESKRAFNESFTMMYDPKPYLDRNHDIVDSVDIMIATPKDLVEELRSGTWATIRYATKMRKPIIICYKDGSVAARNT